MKTKSYLVVGYTEVPVYVEIAANSEQEAKQIALNDIKNLDWELWGEDVDLRPNLNDELDIISNDLDIVS